MVERGGTAYSLPPLCFPLTTVQETEAHPMLGENGLTVDLDAVAEVLHRADVLTIGFTTFPERLLIDTRSNDQAGPMSAIVGPVATVQERYLWLGQHRGMFGAPQAFSFFVWPHTIQNLVERDVLAPMRERLAEGSAGACAELDRLLQQLTTREEEAIRDAVRGTEAFQTLWQRAS